jgi:hypothetical protein
MAMTEEESGITATTDSGGTTPQLGFGGKFWSIFVDPRKTFASIGRNHEWIILLVLASLIAIGGYVPVKDYVRQSQLDMMEQYFESHPQISEDQRAEILQSVNDRFDNPMNLLWVPVGFAVRLFIVAGVMLFLANIIFGGSTGYLKMLNATGWVLMITLPATIVTVPLVMAKGSMDVSLGLGVLAGAGMGDFLKTFLKAFDLFTLWQVWLSGVAIAVLAPTSTSKGFWGIFIAWMVWVLAQSGLSAIGIPIMM